MEEHGLLSSIARMIDAFSTAIQKFQTPSLLAGTSSSAPAAPPLVLRAQEDLQRLRRMLPWVRAVLKDAEEWEILDESVRLWLRELRLVADDADDVLDEFEYHGLRADVGARAKADARAQRSRASSGKRRRLHDQFSDALLKIDDDRFWGELAPRIEQVRRRFEEIYERRMALRLTEEDGDRRRLCATGASTRTPSSCFINTPCFYGREEERRKVIDEFLLSDQCLARNLSVIPIVGMGGVGKTTLVQHVYNDQAVSKHFGMKGWVCVSDEFELVALTRRILEALTKKSHPLSEFSALQEVLRSETEGKRFLLVLDDLWNERHELWDKFQAALCFGAKGSAIVTTTRSERVAAVVQTAPPLCLRCLSNEECWKIFQQYAFDGRDHPSCNQDLVAIGRRIVLKCRGLPLAVTALGGLLRSKPDAQSWGDILQSDLWDLDEQGDEVLSALRLSYLHLKTNLKQCFVYCSIFPKDYRFTKSQLVHMWVALGFIQHRSSRQVEDIGSDYFEELLQRSFFQHCERSSPDLLEEHEDIHVVMHDLIHDLAQSISRGECFRIEHGKSQSLPITEARHLSWVGSIPSCNTVAVGALRTLMILKAAFLPQNQSRLLNTTISNLQCVRVLDLSHLPIHVLPDAIGNLIHLRYLDLSYTQIQKLPKSVCKLYHMQTLLLTGCQGLRGLPKGTKNLTNLRTLPVFYVGRHGEECGVEELKDLVNLRGSLKICRLSSVLKVEDAKVANLRNKASLRELRLSWVNVSGDRVADLRKKASPSRIDMEDKRWGIVSRRDSSDAPIYDQMKVFENLEPPPSLQVLEIFNYDGLSFPGWMGSPALDKLAKVEIYCCFKCKLLPPLGQLPYLKRLHIRFALSVECIGSEFRGNVQVAFPSLEELVFEYLYCWKEWRAVERGDFPRLHRLEIRYCFNLWGILPILHPLPMLEELVLQRCGRLRWVPLYVLPSLELLHVDHWSALPSSSLSLPEGLPPPRNLETARCSCALFSPAEQGKGVPFPCILRFLSIYQGCPLLLEWRPRCGHKWLSGIDDVKFRVVHLGEELASYDDLVDIIKVRNDDLKGIIKGSNDDLEDKLKGLMQSDGISK